MTTEPDAPAKPVRSHRRAGAPVTHRGRIRWRFGQAVAIVLTLIAGAAIAKWTPDADAQQRPYLRSAAIGQRADARSFDVTVRSVRGGSILSDSGGKHDTSGVWVVVGITVEARTAPATVQYATVVDSAGRSYNATGRVDQLILGGRDLQPGVPVTAEIAFEVPVSVAPTLSVQFSPAVLRDTRMDALVQVPLNITSSEVDQWRANKTPLTLATPTEAG